MIYSGDRDHTLDDLAATVARTIKGLRPHSHQFDTIACSGLSGIVVASPVALALKKALVIVRKPYDHNNHSNNRVEGIPGERYVILDDFSSTGKTCRSIAQNIGRYVVDAQRYNGRPIEKKLVHVADFFYQDCNWLPRNDRGEIQIGGEKL